MALSGANFSGLASSSCTYNLIFNLQAQGGVGTNARIDFANGEFIEVLPGSFPSTPTTGILNLSDSSGDITVSVTGNSSLWDWSIIVTEDTVEINNTGNTGDGAGTNSFVFTPQCGKEYVIVLVSNQHA